MNKLIISDFYKNILLGFFFVDDVLERIYPLQGDVVDNIYAGYVKDIVKNINSAFIEFDNDKKGFLPLKYCEDKELRQGDKVLVQVYADKVKTKDYVLTTNISLKSHDLILTSNNKTISISKKITDSSKREELKSAMQAIEPNVGFVIRTSAGNREIEELQNQAKQLMANYESLKKRFTYSTSKALLQSKDEISLICEKLSENDGLDIITDSKEIYKKIIEAGWNCIYNDDKKVSLQNKYSLGRHIDEVLNSKVWLKSGGYLIIEHTEALTVIDVNTGKANMKKNREETFLKINKEALYEILRQLRLRNITGLIIVDFINMKDEKSNKIICNEMCEAAKEDYTQCVVVGFTKLGLMEITRKKQHKPLNEILR